MAKRISILEGGTGRKITVSALRVDTQSGGDSIWIPEDEVPLDYTFISKNGTYKPERYGFSQAHVYVPQYVRGYNTEIGEYQLITFDPYTFAPISVDLPSNFPDLNITPYVIGPVHFDPLDPSVFNLEVITFDPETGDIIKVELPEAMFPLVEVLVPKADEIIIAFNPDKDGFEVAIQPIDGDGLKIDDFPFDTILDIEGNPIDKINVPEIDFESGDFIWGMDEDTGDIGMGILDDDGLEVVPVPYTPDSYNIPDGGYVHASDEDGNEAAISYDKEERELTITPLPSSLEIVVPPNKMDYTLDEQIDLTGMVVVAKNADGSTWTNEKYPNGHIPLGELEVWPTRADGRVTSNIVNCYLEGKVQPVRVYFNFGDYYSCEITTASTYQAYEYDYFFGHNHDYAILSVTPRGWLEPFPVEHDGYRVHYQYYTNNENGMVGQLHGVISKTEYIHASGYGQELYHQPFPDNPIEKAKDIIEERRKSTSKMHLDNSIEWGGDTVYYSGIYWSQAPLDMPTVYDGSAASDVSNRCRRLIMESRQAYEALYNDVQQQPINLSWVRPVDDKILETELYVNTTVIYNEV